MKTVNQIILEALTKEKEQLLFEEVLVNDTLETITDYITDIMFDMDYALIADYASDAAKLQTRLAEVKVRLTEVEVAILATEADATVDLLEFLGAQTTEACPGQEERLDGLKFAIKVGVGL